MVLTTKYFVKVKKLFCFISTLALDPRSPEGERRMGKPINLAVITIVCYYKKYKAAGLAVSVCGATVRPERGSALEAGAMLAQLLCKRQQKAPISDVRESRVVAQAQRREDVKDGV